MHQNKVDYTLYGHTDTVTGLSLCKEGNGMLASNSMDNNVRIWDIRPFINQSNDPSRQLGLLKGHKHNPVEKNLIQIDWSHDNKYIASGSSDRIAYVWDAVTG